MHSGRPDLGEHGRIKAGAIGDHLLGVDARLLEMDQEGSRHVRIDSAVHQLIAHQAIPIWRGGIHRQEQGQFVLVDFIHAKNTGKLAHYPGLVVGFEVEARAVEVAPLADHALAGLHPKVTGQSLRHAAHRHTIAVNGFHSFFDHPAAVGGVLALKRRLGTEIVLTGQTMMNADGYLKQDGMLQIKVNRQPLGSAIVLGGEPAGITGRIGHAISYLADGARRLVDSRQDSEGSFPGKLDIYCTTLPQVRTNVNFVVSTSLVH